MGLSLKYLLSFVREEVLESTSSPYHERLEVWYVYGKKTLNAKTVNFSFGQLDSVFRSAFSQLKIEKREIRDVLVLGLGAGNIPAILEEHDKDYRIVGVEIDPEVIRLAKKHFDLDRFENLTVTIGDAMNYVEECAQKFDLIVVDLFVDALVPKGAEQEKFLKKLGEMLRKGGLLLFNRLRLDEELEKQTEVFTRKMKDVLPGTQYLRAQKNRMLYYEKK